MYAFQGKKLFINFVGGEIQVRVGGNYEKLLNFLGVNEDAGGKRKTKKEDNVDDLFANPYANV